MQKTIDQISEALKKYGYKLTKERKQCIDFLLTIPSHFSLNDLIDELKKQKIVLSRASLYRTMPILEEIGFVKAVYFQNGRQYYEVIIKNKHHEHLFCKFCHKNVEFDDTELESFFNKVFKKFGFKPHSHKVELLGVCNECHLAKQNIMHQLTLADLKPGESGLIIKLVGTGALKKRLLEMGLTKNKQIKVIKTAPLGDPIEIKIRGYELSIRKKEAENILIKKHEK